MIFQQFNLVGRLDVLTNVLMGRLAAVPTWRSLLGLWTDDDKAIALSALEQFDIGSARGAARRSTVRRPAAARRHRARAGAGAATSSSPTSRSPRSIRATPRIVMDALLRINKHFGITVICNLHSLDLARSYCDRLVGMAAGRVVFDGAPASSPTRSRASSTASKPAR